MAQVRRISLILWQKSYDVVESILLITKISFIFPFIDPPAGSVTFQVTTVTKEWGTEIRWQIGANAGNCENERTYGDDNSYSQSCQLPAGTHTIKCKDTYGDGWHGGYLEINGAEYCKTFTNPRPNGYEKSESVTL